MRMASSDVIGPPTLRVSRDATGRRHAVSAEICGSTPPLTVLGPQTARIHPNAVPAGLWDAAHLHARLWYSPIALPRSRDVHFRWHRAILGVIGR